MTKRTGKVNKVGLAADTGFKRLLRTVFYRALTPVYRLSPAASFRIIHFVKFGTIPNIEQPETLREKLQWLKLHYRHPLYVVCADKYTVRAYVEENGFGDMLNTLLWHGERAEDIPFDTLPDRFVLKATHGSGYNIIVRDKSALDRRAVIRTMRRWLKTTYIECYGEWFYGVHPPSIICEALIEGEVPGRVPDDYKVYCYNGKARLIQCAVERFTDSHARVLYDTDWQRTEINFSNKFDERVNLPRPARLEEMLFAAEKLAEPFPYVRVDFFIQGGRLIIGEMTLINSGGFGSISPEAYNKILGSWLTLPEPIA